MSRDGSVLSVFVLMVFKVFKSFSLLYRITNSSINLSQAASGMILQNHRWLPVSIFSVKIDRCIRVLEMGNWKDF